MVCSPTNGANIHKSCPPTNPQTCRNATSGTAISVSSRALMVSAQLFTCVEDNDGSTLLWYPFRRRRREGRRALFGRQISLYELGPEFYNGFMTFSV